MMTSRGNEKDTIFARLTLLVSFQFQTLHDLPRSVYALIASVDCQRSTEDQSSMKAWKVLMGKNHPTRP